MKDAYAIDRKEYDLIDKYSELYHQEYELLKKMRKMIGKHFTRVRISFVRKNENTQFNSVKIGFSFVCSVLYWINTCQIKFVL